MCLDTCMYLFACVYIYTHSMLICIFLCRFIRACRALRPPAPVNSGRVHVVPQPYRGTSFIENCALVGPYSRMMPRAVWWP